MDKITNEEMFDAILRIAVPRAGQKELDAFYAADPNLVMSKGGKRRLRRRLAAVRRYHEKHETYRPVWEGAKRVAIIVLVVLSVGFVSVVQIDAVREAIWNVVMEWFDDYVKVSYEAEKVVDKIEVYKEPRAIGKEFERYECIKDDKVYAIEYESATNLISYEQRILKQNSIYYTNENTLVEDINIQGYHGYAYISYINQYIYTTLVWNDGIYKYELAGNYKSETLLEIAESVS